MAGRADPDRDHAPAAKSGILPGADMLTAVACGLGTAVWRLFQPARTMVGNDPSDRAAGASASMLMVSSSPAGPTGGGSVLGSIGPSFRSIDRHTAASAGDHPRGVLLTLAVVAGLETFIEDEAITGGISSSGWESPSCWWRPCEPMGGDGPGLDPGCGAGLAGMSMIAFTANLIPCICSH